MMPSIDNSLSFDFSASISLAVSFSESYLMLSSITPIRNSLFSIFWLSFGIISLVSFSILGLMAFIMFSCTLFIRSAMSLYFESSSAMVRRSRSDRSFSLGDIIRVKVLSFHAMLCQNIYGRLVCGLGMCVTCKISLSNPLHFPPSHLEMCFLG